MILVSRCLARDSVAALPRKTKPGARPGFEVYVAALPRRAVRSAARQSGGLRDTMFVHALAGFLDDLGDNANADKLKIT